MPNPQPQIHFFDLKTGWSTAPDPFRDGCTDEDIREAGFDLFAQPGVEGGFQVTVYRGSDRRFLVFVDGRACCETIMAADLPSMVELVHKLTPMALASQVQAIQDVATDLQELLVREHGPLEEAYHARWRRQRAEVEKSKHLPQKA